MNRSLVTGLVIGAGVATAGGAIAGYAVMNRGPDYAQVVDVKPVTRTIRTPREECHEEQVTQQAPTRDGKQVTGTVAGAVVQKRMQERNTVTTAEQRCETVYDTHEERIGFNIRYRLGGLENTVRMDHDPGERIPVRDGQLVLTKTEDPVSNR